MKSSFYKNSKYNKKNNIANTPENKTTQSKKSIREDVAVSDSIKNLKMGNQVISGCFLKEKSYKEIVIQRVNTILCFILSFLLLFCFVCYYFVSCKEVQLNQISRETLELNYENEELQNKVDSLQSYYNIDKAVSKSNILERAKQVVEVNAVGLPNVDLNKIEDKTSNAVISY